MALNYDWSGLNAKVDPLYPADDTNQGIGLAWAFHTLTAAPSTYSLASAIPARPYAPYAGCADARHAPIADCALYDTDGYLLALSFS